MMSAKPAGSALNIGECKEIVVGATIVLSKIKTVFAAVFTPSMSVEVQKRVT
jgi:hypothetical protein